MWDLSTQHCLQTVVGHRCEIWSLVAADMDAHTTVLLTGHDTVCMYACMHVHLAYVLTKLCMYVCVCEGGSDEFLRGYQVKPLTSSSVLDEQVRNYRTSTNFYCMYVFYMYVSMYVWAGRLRVLRLCFSIRVHASAAPYIH